MAFGKRVLGEEAWQRQQAAQQQAEAAGMKLGPRVTGAPTATVEPEPPTSEEEPQGDGLQDEVPGEDVTQQEEDVDEEQSSPTTLSLKDLEGALKANATQELRDQLFDLETRRPEGEPRKGALRLFLKAEQDSEDPRPAVIADIQNLLGNL